MSFLNARLRIYVEAYEAGSLDLRTINKFLSETGHKFVVKNGRVIEIIGL